MALAVGVERVLAVAVAMALAVTEVDAVVVALLWHMHSLCRGSNSGFVGGSGSGGRCGIASHIRMRKLLFSHFNTETNRSAVAVDTGARYQLL